MPSARFPSQPVGSDINRHESGKAQIILIDNASLQRRLDIVMQEVQIVKLEQTQ